MGQNPSVAIGSRSNLYEDEIRNNRNKPVGDDPQPTATQTWSIEMIKHAMLDMRAFSLAYSAESNTTHNPKDTNHQPTIEECKGAAPIDPSTYAVQYDHVQIPIVEFMNSIDTANTKQDSSDAPDADPYCGDALLKLYDKMHITSDDCSIWQNRVSSQQNGRNQLATVIHYLEKSGSSYSAPSEQAKLKMRAITKILSEGDNVDDYKHICLLLASHANVCNVMKEVAINNAYGMLTNNLKEYVDAQSLQQQVLKVLRDLRVLLIEKMFHDFGFGNNTHVIAGFHNTMAKEVGVESYLDPDISYPSSSKHRNWRTNLGKRFLGEVYTRERIVEWVYKQIEEKKIGYQKMVAFLEKECPVGMASGRFLESVIDVDSGRIDEGYMCWMLGKLGVLVEKGDDWQPMEKCWED